MSSFTDSHLNSKTLRNLHLVNSVVSDAEENLRRPIGVTLKLIVWNRKDHGIICRKVFQDILPQNTKL
jgi:hypothetical protein